MTRLKLYLLLVAFFLVLGCSKKYGTSKASYAPVPAAARTEGLAYDYGDGAVYESTRWEGTGYNLEGSDGIESDTSKRFRDMSNLYGGIVAGGSAAEQEILENDLERKIVMTAFVRVRVENLDKADTLIKDLMKKYNAYASSTDIDDNSRRYSIRVPSSAYKTAIDEINGLGRLLGRSENAEDVSLRYYDLEGRLATKKELLKTFQSYLGKAKTIEEILSVEKRIAELQYEIEGTGKELRNLANRVDYATIELSVFGPIASSPYRGPTLGERLKELFGSFGTFLSIMATVIIGIVIFGIPILLLLILFFWLLFGKIGLLKKLWRLAAGKNR